MALLLAGLSVSSAAHGEKAAPSAAPDKPAAQPRRSSKPGVSSISVKAVKASKAATGRTDAASKKSKRSGRRGPREQADRWPAMSLEAVNTKEKAHLRLYDKKGRTIRASVKQLWRLMRCHVTGKEHPIHWRLLRNLYRISRRYPGKTIYIYSGYRARKAAELAGSNHIKGRAVDLRVAGVSNQSLRDHLLGNFKPCGVGYYPKSPFVHFDVREKQSAFWVDYSGKGEAAEYASDPYQVVRDERAAVRTKARADGQRIAPSAPKASSPAETAGAAEATAAEAATRSTGSKKTEEAKQEKQPATGSEQGPGVDAAEQRAPRPASSPESHAAGSSEEGAPAKDSAASQPPPEASPPSSAAPPPGDDTGAVAPENKRPAAPSNSEESAAGPASPSEATKAAR